jgi:hypothetical protein
MRLSGVNEKGALRTKEGGVSTSRQVVRTQEDGEIPTPLLVLSLLVLSTP